MPRLSPRSLLSALFSSILCMSVLFGLLISCSTPPPEHSLEPKAILQNIYPTKAHQIGQISITHQTDKMIRAPYFRPRAHNATDGPILIILPGTQRNVVGAISAFMPIAEAYGAMIIAPEFSRQDFPTGDDYTLGTTRGAANASALKNNRWRAISEYNYSIVEQLFDVARQQIDGRQTGYYLFGHSAGAQFAHRLITFLPEHRALKVVAANAGWYTLPHVNGATQGRNDSANFAFPYGLAHTPITDPSHLLRTNLSLLLSADDAADTDAGRTLRQTPEAQAQGKNRLQRGLNYFASASTAAAAMNIELNWQKYILPLARHSISEVAWSAGNILFGDKAPCRSNTDRAKWQDIVISAYNSDPAKGRAGDLNQDGIRHPQDDEFVELRNSTAQAKCLVGWSLYDQKALRHLFPHANSLAPEEKVRIFGGGAPQLDIKNERLRTLTSSSGKLSLSREGDHIRLYDQYGQLVDEVCWGSEAAKCTGK